MMGKTRRRRLERTKHLKRIGQTLAVTTTAGMALWAISPANAMADETPHFSGGSGTASDPYVVDTVQELQDIASDPSASYVLGEDINITSDWQTISGTFSGTFNGEGHKISGLTDSLFDELAGATIENLHLDVSIDVDTDEGNEGAVAKTATEGTTLVRTSVKMGMSPTMEPTM